MTSDVTERRSGSVPRRALAISFVACYVSIHGVTARQRLGDVGDMDIGTFVPRDVAEVRQP